MWNKSVLTPSHNPKIRSIRAASYDARLSAAGDWERYAKPDRPSPSIPASGASSVRREMR